MGKISRTFVCIVLASALFLALFVGSVSTEGEDGPEGPEATFTHTVLAEEETATWCVFCPNAAEGLFNVYESHDYPFYFVAMIIDVNDDANQRARGDYNVPGYPTVNFDGGYKNDVGASSPSQAEAKYRPSIEECGERVAHGLEIDVNVVDLGGASLDISVEVRNLESSDYAGHIRTYIVEKVSRYLNYDGNPYHFGFLNYAFNEDINIGPSSNWNGNIVWNGSDHQDSLGDDFGDINPANIMVIAAVFNGEGNPSDYSPNYPDNDFTAYYVDQVAGAEVGPLFLRRVDSNGDFDSAHGVSGGSGTQADPWIIEDLDIDGTGSGYSYYIGNTTDHFVVRNSVLSGASGGANPPYFPDSGLVLYNVQNATIENNTIDSNEGDGIRLSLGSSNNVVANNSVSDNGYGIHLSSSNGNTIEGNTVENNEYGIYLESSIDNGIYHNNITGNTNQAYDDSGGNLWDGGYPSGGNSWSDYSGDDIYSGVNQDEPGSDGIGDSPYVIDPDSRDRYPLVEPTLPVERIIPLSEGWNLVSISLIRSDTTLASLLDSIQGEYDAVQYYDATDEADPWKHYHRSKPSDMNDLDDVDHTIGFWLVVNEPGGSILSYTGFEPTQDQEIALHQGWNMVGYPSREDKTRTEALNNIVYGTDVDSISTYNPTTQEWEELGDSDYFEVGRGYWIHSLVEKIWEVPI